MSHYNMLNIGLSRKTSEYVRGLAILLIMLHNLCHIFPAIVTENEFTYNPVLTGLFMAHASSGHPLLIYDILSFLGWYGVPVFVFLSGYGLTAKYGAGETPLNLREFILRNWRKLLLLMIPGVTAFIIEELIHSGVPTPDRASLYAGMLIPLTGLNDLAEAWLPTVPGVYWYFGLTLELYIVYALIVHGRSLRNLALLTAVCFALVAMTASMGREVLTVALPGAGPIRINPEALTEYLRHNFTGWLLPFFFGIFLARAQKCSARVAALCILASLTLFLPFQTHPLTWQLAAVPAVIIIIGLARLLQLLPGVGAALALCGRISPFLFVSHPLVRHILGRYFFDFTSQSALPTPAIVTAYLALTFATALMYRFVWKGLTSISSGRLQRDLRMWMRSLGSGAPKT